MGEQAPAAGAGQNAEAPTGMADRQVEGECPHEPHLESDSAVNRLAHAEVRARFSARPQQNSRKQPAR